MQLTAFTDYSLRTLMYLQDNSQDSFSIKHIAEHFNISRNHLVKIVHRLSQLEYIETKKGKGGGIKIAPDSRKLRLGNLIACLEPNMNMVECFDPATNQCRLDGACQLKHYLKKATDAYICSLNQHTLEDAIGKGLLP